MDPRYAYAAAVAIPIAVWAAARVWAAGRTRTDGVNGDDQRLVTAMAQIERLRAELAQANKDLKFLERWHVDAMKEAMDDARTYVARMQEVEDRSQGRIAALEATVKAHHDLWHEHHPGETPSPTVAAMWAAAGLDGAGGHRPTRNKVEVKIEQVAEDTTAVITSTPKEPPTGRTDLYE